jgi:acyl-CoA hydrolase
MSQLPKLMANGRCPIDVALVQVSPPNHSGFVSLGVSTDITLAALLNAKRVIAEINPNMPFTFGDSVVHASRIERFVINPAPITEYSHPEVDEVAECIARYVAGLIDDGSTLHIGLGRTTSGVLKYLGDRRDLGIHSDVITDSVIDLVEKGVLTNHRKTLHRDKIVASYCIGTRRLYDFVDRNPLFEFKAIEYVCDPEIIERNHQMVSMAQAFAIDLSGQICVDQYKGEFYGGVSTLPDFLHGAARSPGGKPIICLRSVSEDGKESNIRPRLLPGEGVGVPRSDIHYVVTEYGVAYLFGKCIRERALALIEIAHPDFRDGLLEEAKQLGHLPAFQKLMNRKAYLIEEERTATLNNGQAVRLRPARAGDADGLRDLFHAMDDEDVYTRFFRRIKTLSFDDTQRLCNANFETDVAFVACAGERESEQIVGSGCYFLNPTSNVAEVGYMVAKAWQGSGLGKAMQERMKEFALAMGVRGFKFEILAHNSKMLALAKRSGDNIHVDKEDDTYIIQVLFSDAARTGP